MKRVKSTVVVDRFKIGKFFTRAEGLGAMVKPLEVNEKGDLVVDLFSPNRFIHRFITLSLLF